MHGVLLAAGAGTRLRPVSLKRPKATVPICGRALIHRVMDSLACGGVDDFVVVVQAAGDEVVACCRAWDGRAQVRYVEQPERLGMAHALGYAAPLLDGPFVLSACDTIVAPSFVADLIERHRLGADATLALERVRTPEAIRKIAIVTQQADGRIVGIVEKPEPQDAPSDLGSLPVYVFERSVLELLPAIQPSPRGEYEVQDAIRMLIERGSTVHGLLTDTRRDVTSTADLLQANRWFLDHGETRLRADVACQPPVWIGETAQVARGCRIGPYVVLEDGCQVGEGVELANAVVLRDAVVPDGSRLDGVVLTPQ